jgi:hypothetical protein
MKVAHPSVPRAAICRGYQGDDRTKAGAFGPFASGVWRSSPIPCYRADAPLTVDVARAADRLLTAPFGLARLRIDNSNVRFKFAVCDASHGYGLVEHSRRNGHRTS